MHPSASATHCARDRDIASISVIIPTKNRANDLKCTLESLTSQTRSPDEILVVDQSPEPSFEPGEVPEGVTYIYAPQVSGITVARNVAMERAKGDLLIFLDDDVILEPQYIEEIVRTYQPGVAGVSGIITNYGIPPLSRRVFEKLFVKGAFHDDRQSVYWRADFLRAGGPQRVKQFTGAAMSFRAGSVSHLLFDTNLTGGCLAEDIDFCARLPRSAILLIAPNARLFHKRSTIGRTTAHWLDEHSQSSSYMRRRNWHRGLRDDLCFVWLQFGYALIAAVGSIKRRSLEPFRAWRRGANRGRLLGTNAAVFPAASCPKETAPQG